jgi:hypothetical protein
MLSTLGAPAAFAGFLVPICESGVLLSQMAVAAYIRHMPRRKGVWLLGGALLSALGLDAAGCMRWRRNIGPPGIRPRRIASV